MFLEKNDDIIYGVVEGSKRYLVSVVENKDNHELQLFCNCPYDGFCKHLYTVLLGIKEKREKKFYKIIYNDEKKTMLEKLEDFNYLLCVDIKDDYFVIIDDMEFKLVNILNNKKLQFKIIEDDENKTLEKKLKKYLKKKKIDSK